MKPTRPRVASSVRDRITTGLMVVSARGALYAFTMSIAAVQAAGPATQQVEAWRMFGFLRFAGASSSASGHGDALA